MSEDCMHRKTAERIGGLIAFRNNDYGTFPYSYFHPPKDTNDVPVVRRLNTGCSSSERVARMTELFHPSVAKIYLTYDQDAEQATFALTSSHHVGHLSFDLCEISGAMCLLAQDALPRALLAIIPVEKAAMESGPMIVPQNSTINVAIYPMHHHNILQLLVTGKLSRHESMLPRMTTVAAVGEEFEPGCALSETR